MGGIRHIDAVLAFARTVFCALLVIASCGFGAGVALAYHEVAGSSLRFSGLTSEDGLAQNWVATLLQDQAGYMWIGTHGGLHRYDGYEMLTFLHDPLDPRSVSDNSISALHQDASGTLWVGTGTAGINRFDAQTHGFVRYRNEVGNSDSLVHNRVWALTSDGQGRLWIATDGGLDSLDPATGAITHHVMTADGARARVVRALATDHSGRVWIGTFSGLYFVDPMDMTVEAYPLVAGRAQGTEKVSISALYEDRAGRLWVGSNKGVTRISADRGTVDKLLLFEGRAHAPAGGRTVVTGIVDDDRGNFWIATDGEGLFRIHGEQDVPGHFSHYHHDAGNPFGVPDNYLSAAIRDATGVLWFGTSIGGVSRLNPSMEAFAHYRRSGGSAYELPGNVVWSIYEDDSGDVWVATESGLSLLETDTGRFSTVPLEAQADNGGGRADMVYYVMRSSTGDFWVGTEAGLFRFDDALEKFEFHDVFAAYSDIDYIGIVHFITEDSDGVLWLGTFNGVIRYDTSVREARLISRARGELVDDWVMAVVEGRDGAMWVGTEGGLQKLDRRTGQSIAVFRSEPGNANSLSHDSVQSLYRSSNGGLWIGTVAGLNHLNPQTGRFVRYGRDQGLPSDYIYAVTGDDSGLLWLSTNQGLARLDPATGTVVTFDVSDGLQASEFNTGAVHRGKSGRLFFGGINGFNAFRPDDVIANPQPPRVAVTSVQFVDGPTLYGDDGTKVSRLVVSPEHPVFSFRFAAFDFEASHQNRFSYMLEGVDPEWRDGGTTNSVLYSNLHAGNYAFRVRAANSDGVWSNEDAVVTVRVLPAFWQSRQALFAYCAVLLGIVWLGFRLWSARAERERLLRSEQQKRSIAERMHRITQGLSATLNTGTVSEQLLGSAVDLVPHNMSALYLVENGELTLIETRGVAESHREQMRAAPLAASATMAQVLAASEPIVIPAASLFGAPGEPQPLGMDQLLCAPLAPQGDDSGLLVLARRSGKPFTLEERKIVGLLVNQALFAFQNARLFSEIERQAITDDLTGLHNRRHFLDLARREFSRSVRYESKLSLILIDADYFKNVNDQFGHQVGDEVLRRIAVICDSATRDFDIVGRYGGEEFVIVLPETDRDVATAVARRIRDGVAQAVTLSERLTVRMTISAGVAEKSANTPDLLSLINAADQALYAAKGAGRNQVVTAATGSPPEKTPAKGAAL